MRAEWWPAVFCDRFSDRQNEMHPPIGKGKWYKGTISRAHSNGTYDVRYADGDSEKHVMRDMVRADTSRRKAGGASRRSRADGIVSSSTKADELDRGSKVEANYKGSSVHNALSPDAH